MAPIKRTEDGVLITGRTLGFAKIAIALLASIATGVAGAIRFIDRAKDSLPRQEFVQWQTDHVRADSETHAAQRSHDAFQDSVIAQQGRDNHGVTCYVYRNPLPFCSDRLGYPTRPGGGPP